MEPRWDHHAERYIGGTPDFDLWQSKNPRFIVLRAGNASNMWAAYRLVNGKIRGLGENDGNSATDLSMRMKIIEQREEIEQYLALFAPDVGTFGKDAEDDLSDEDF